MREVKIITDSCSDLTTELMERYSIDYVLMNTVLEGKTSPASLSRTKEEVHAFYGRMRNGQRITTTQVPVEEFRRVFTKYLADGQDIVYIACSSKQSGSVNTARVVSEELLKDYPGASVYCVDSLNACLGEGALAIEAAKLAETGVGAEEVFKKVQAMRKSVNEYCTVHSLEFLRRAGRVKGPAAFFGNLMGVKPIIVADADGAQAAFKKVKGRQASFREIVALLKESIVNPEEQTIYLAHADCSEEEVEELKALVKAEIPCKEIYVGYIGPIVGASVGPDAVALFGFGKDVTFRAAE